MAEITGEEQRQGLLAKAFTNLPLNATGWCVKGSLDEVVYSIREPCETVVS